MSEHAHHWICDAPNEATKTVPARCKTCGADRTYPVVPPVTKRMMSPGDKTNARWAQQDQLWRERHAAFGTGMERSGNQW